jgi:hypothetical protein
MDLEPAGEVEELAGAIDDLVRLEGGGARRRSFDDWTPTATGCSELQRPGPPMPDSNPPLDRYFFAEITRTSP